MLYYIHIIYVYTYDIYVYMIYTYNMYIYIHIYICIYRYLIWIHMINGNIGGWFQGTRNMRLRAGGRIQIPSVKELVPNEFSSERIGRDLISWGFFTRSK